MLTKEGGKASSRGMWQALDTGNASKKVGALSSLQVTEICHNPNKQEKIPSHTSRRNTALPIRDFSLRCYKIITCVILSH